MNVGDDIVFLIDYAVYYGTITRVNRATYTVNVPAQRGCVSQVRRVWREGAFSPKDDYVVVWVKLPRERNTHYMRLAHEGEVPWRKSGEYVIEVASEKPQVLL